MRGPRLDRSQTIRNLDNEHAQTATNRRDTSATPAATHAARCTRLSSPPLSSPSCLFAMAAKPQIIRLLTLGDSGAGKSSLLLRYTQNEFNVEYMPTIGIDFRLKTVEIKGKTGANGNEP